MPAESYQAAITNETDLRALYDAPLERVVKKQLSHLDEYCRRLIALSPLMCLATTDASGHVDVSPRGDPPGFVKVLDDRTVLIPDRKGNRRIDTMSNILANPAVGVLFLLPGVQETLRINGRASLVDDPAVLAGCEVNGQAPKLGIRIDIDDVFFHCAKALIRSKLWEKEAQIARNEFPTYGQIIRDQREPEKSADDIDAGLTRDYKENLY